MKKLCTVETNSADDVYKRVKLSHPNFWSELSPLIPSLNGVALSKGDQVLVDLTEMASPLILGRIFTKPQLDNNELQGMSVGIPEGLLFKFQNDNNWVMASGSPDEFVLETSKGLVLTFNQTSIPPQIKLSANKKGVGLLGRVTGTEPGFTCVPNCLFSGAPHVSGTAPSATGITPATDSQYESTIGILIE